MRTAIFLGACVIAMSISKDTTQNGGAMIMFVSLILFIADGLEFFKRINK